MTDIETIIESTWQDRVASRYIYRGMGLNDLSDPLDPRRNPHAGVLPLLKDCLALLQRVVDSGFHFTLVETHWGHSWKHELKNIVAWSRNDIENPRIDFISSVGTAREYSDNWQGSQLKQNMKYIAEHLPAYRDDPILRQVLNTTDWHMLKRVEMWVNDGSNHHKGIVLCVRRSHAGLRSKTICAPIGALPDFRSRILQEIERRGLPRAGSSVAGLLPKETDGFDAYLTEPLWKRDIERIEETAEPSAGAYALPRAAQP